MMGWSVGGFWYENRWWILPLAVFFACTFHCAGIVRKRRITLRRAKNEPNLVSNAGQTSEERRRMWYNEKNNGPVETAMLDAVQSKKAPKKITGTKRRNVTTSDTSSNPWLGAERIRPILFFSSLSGSTEKFASLALQKLVSYVEKSTQTSGSRLLPPELLDLSYVEYDDYFTSLPKSQPQTKYFYIILIPSYNIDTVLTNFLDHLRETHHDFRVDTAPLRNILGYGVFGLGDKNEWPSEEEGFCSQGKEVDMWMAKLTNRKRAYPLGLGDVCTDAGERLKIWLDGILDVLKDLSCGRGLGNGVPGSGDAVESDDEEDDTVWVGQGKPKTLNQNRSKLRKASVLDDVETIGATLASTKADRSSGPIAIDFTTTTKPELLKQTPSQPIQAMVPTASPTYAALTKQGYSIIGTHSGVKICRWTKSALRGRGSCYKYSFYGIQSHLCMETTPSLSCSNKCVFCWRHGTNPIGTTWRWQIDPPDLIFNGAKDAHYKKIKMMRGVPGVRAERFEEAMRIRHCALSLVGEPIFYPHINGFLSLLHGERISSFLVCNAQHPAQLAALNRVTQLYVSIDASNRESLRRIDRPLHRDFWERFNACLDILAEKRFVQRTVFRLTLVKGFNLEDEAQGYADLVARGMPCFIEVKGVTYCGTATSAGAGLTMQNVPFYEEVCEFVRALDKALTDRGLEYGIAAEHAHSCCILLASTRFYINEKWHTTINYSRFFELLEGTELFSPEDYCSETPEWALWGNGGFDPRDERVDRKGRKKVVGNSQMHSRVPENAPAESEMLGT